MKPFSQWSIVEVEETFQLMLRKQSAPLADWLTIRSQPSPEERILLGALREKLADHVYDWNEYELIVKFITPLLAMVNFDQEAYQSFFEREISVTYHDEALSGIVDFIVATGKRTPKHPYFFLHEYKRELASSNDPLGQLLVAMIAAQHLNHDENPVYGAYIMGRLWNFVLLSGMDYAVSLSYDATKNDVRDIFCILQQTKTIIERFIRDEKK